MDKLSYKQRQINFKQENTNILGEIIPAPDNYQAQQNYENLMKQTNEQLRKSGQPAIENNKINPFLKGLLKLIKLNQHL